MISQNLYNDLLALLGNEYVTVSGNIKNWLKQPITRRMKPLLRL